MEIEQATEETVLFNYIKNSHFRVVHVDGVLASMTPRGLVHCAVFSERPSIPQKVEYIIDSEGNLEEIERESRAGIVREIDVDLMMDIHTTKELIQVLQNTLIELEKL